MIALKINPPDAARLNALSSKVDVSACRLAHIAIRALLDLADRQGGTITLPLTLPDSTKPNPSA